MRAIPYDITYNHQTSLYDVWIMPDGERRYVGAYPRYKEAKSAADEARLKVCAN